MPIKSARIPLAILVAGLSVLPISCNDNNSSVTAPPAASQPGTVPTPNASPSPSPTPTPTPTPQISWSQVREQKTCPFPDCPGALGFTVTRSGQYFVDSESAGGRVTANERAQLDVVATVVASNLGFIGFDCVSIDVLPGMSSVDVNLTLSDGTTVLIYQISTDQQTKCFRGSLQTAEALFQSIDTLTSKYDVAPAG